MKKLIIIFAFLFSCITLSSAVQARIVITIDQASEKKFPIAIPDFVTEEGNKAGGTKKFTELLVKDLKITSLFQILDNSVLPQEDSDVDKINFEKWRALEVGALVKGVVKKEDGDRVYDMRIYDVDEKQLIFRKKYSVSSKDMTEKTHIFVDDLMETLTGIRGPFHSYIAASCGKPMKRTIGSFYMDNEKSKGPGSRAAVNNMSPSFSPDGKTLAYHAFTSKKDGSIEIFVGNRQVTNLGSTTITPAWTPDGNLIIASAYKGSTDLYVVSQKGRVLRRLTNSFAIDFNPSVSGNQVVFASERAGGLQLFASSLNGGGVRQLTYTGYQNEQPDWSPDGSKIVFSGKDRGEFDIFIMDSDGSNILRLTRGQGSNEAPSWAPDSRYIAYHSTNGGIHIMLEDGRGNHLIEKTQGCNTLDWGPWLSKN
ncbi:MAG: PD40 domain-containing protein [Deltaproteobacteria bacterium]|nr:PD40 domain-containing protein [Deltaproteobacteria bacterium]